MTTTPALFGDFADYEHPLLKFDDLDVDERSGQYADKDEAAATMLASIVGPIPDGDALAIWRINPHQRKEFRTSWHTDYRSAASAARALKDEVYFGLALQPAGLSSRERGGTDSARQIAAVWVDLDVGQSGHKGKAYPPTFDDARRVLRRLPRNPSIVIHSGNGLHAYWCLERPLRLADPEQSLLAQRLMHGWAHAIRVLLETHSWTYDKGVTIDRARVLRVPYTINAKDLEHRKPVTFDVTGGRPWVETKAIYDPKELLDLVGHNHMDEAGQTRLFTTGGRVAPIAADGLALRHPDAIPADERNALNQIVEASCEIGEFRSLWEGTRKQKLGGGVFDASPSGYCMALANWAIRRLELTNQQTIDLMTLWRHKHKVDLKLDRMDVARMTIAKARQVESREQAAEKLAAVNEGTAASDPNSAPATPRQKRLELCGQMCGVRIFAVLKFAGDPPSYCLSTEGGRVDSDNVRLLTDQRTFSDAIATAANVYPSELTKDEWPTLREALLACIEEITVGGDATIEGQTRTILSEYCDAMGVLGEPPANKVEAAPYLSRRQLHIHKPDLLKWLGTAGRHLTAGAKALTAARLGRMMRALGGEEVVVRFGASVAKRWRFDEEATAAICGDVRGREGGTGVEALETEGGEMSDVTDSASV